MQDREKLVIGRCFDVSKEESLHACGSWCHGASIIHLKHTVNVVFHVRFMAPADGRIRLHLHTDKKGATIGSTPFYISRASHTAPWSVARLDNSIKAALVEHGMSFEVFCACGSVIFELLPYLPKCHEHRKTIDAIVAKHTGPVTETIYDYQALYTEIEALPARTQKAIFLEQFKQCGLYIRQHGIAF